MTNPTPHGQVPNKYLTVVYRDIAPGKEARELIEHPKMSASSWSHALNDRDAAIAQVSTLRTAHVQNPAEIEHDAGDVSKNGAGLNMSTQHTRIAELEAQIEALSGVQALSAAPAIAKLRHLYQNMVNGAVRDTASAKRIAEGLLAPAIEALERATPPAEQQVASSAVLKAIHEANMQLVRTGDDAFMLVPYKVATVEQQAAPKAAPGVGNSGFDHKTAADLLNNKTVSDEAVRKFVQASRWAHDEKASLSAMLLSVRGVLASREAEIALLKKALLEAEAAPKQEAQEPCGWTTGITWRPDTRLQSEQVIKITRDTQPKYGYTTPIYTAPQPAPATQQAGDVVAYLDVGAGGYLDLGSELSEDALQQLPKGRHALVIAGTYGIDGYVAAPQPSPTTKPAPQQEAQEPCPTCVALARTVMLDQVSFDRKPDCYGIRQITDDEGVEEWEDIRTSPDVAREEANDMMATGRGEIYEVVPLYTAPLPAPAPLSEMPYEKRKAIQEGEQIGASDAWFHARHNMLDTLDRRNVFRAGFDRGWNAALAAQGGE